MEEGRGSAGVGPRQVDVAIALTREQVVVVSLDGHQRTIGADGETRTRRRSSQVGQVRGRGDESHHRLDVVEVLPSRVLQL